MPLPFKSAYSMQVSARSFVTLVPVAYSFRREEVTQHPSCWLCAHTFCNVGFIPRFQASLAQQAAGRGHGCQEHLLTTQSVACVCARVFPSCTSVNRGPPTAAAILFSCHGCLAQLAVRTGGLSGWQHAHGQSCLWWWGLFSSLWRCSEQSALVQRLTALQTMQANRPRRTNPREWVLRPLETNRSSKPAKDVSKT